MGWQDDPVVQATQAPWENDPIVQQNKLQTGLSLRFGAEENPDKAAQNINLAKRYGLPVSVVQQFPDEFSNRAKTEDAQSAIASAPKLQGWLANPNNAAIAHDDLHNAAAIEQTGQFGNDLLNILPDYVKGLNQTAVTGLKGASLAAATIPMALDKAFGTNLTDKWFANTTAPLDVLNEKMNVRPEAGFIGKVSHQIGGLVGMVMEAEMTAPAAVESASMALWPTIRDMVAHGAGAMAIPSLSSAIEAGQQMYEKTGNGLDAFNAAKAAYLTSTAMAIIPFSAGGGVAQRALTGFSAGVMTGELSREYTNWNMPEGMQQPASFEEAMLSGIMGAGFGIMGPRGNKGLNEAIRQTYTDASKAEAAEREFQKLSTIGQLAEASKIRERDPVAFKNMVETMTEGNDVYIEGKTLANVLHQTGISEENLAQTLPDVAKELPEAVATNGYVRIPIKDYATHLAGSDIDQAILPHLKADPEGMTYQEGQNYIKNQSTSMMDLAKKVVEQKQGDDAFMASRQKVYDDVQQQMIQAGRSPDEAKTAAVLHREFTTLLGERLGITPEEAYKQLGMNVAGELGIGGFNQSNPVEQVRMLADKLDTTQADAEQWFRNGYRIDPETRDFVRVGNEKEALFQESFHKAGEPFASYNPETRTIALLKNANLSSFIHESGHYFVDTYAKVAARPDAPELIKHDMGKMLDWLGIKATPEASALDQWHSMSLDEQRPYHEKLAKGFEQYIMEGKAPSVELRPYFARMKSWMLRVYQSIKSLGEPVNDEVKGVFDRMLASEDAIKQAEQVRGYEALFKTPEEAAKLGMNAKAYAEYQALGNQATDKAIEELQARSLRDMKWLSNAKSKQMKALQQEASGLRREARIEARRDVLQQPVYRAWQYLTRKGEDTGKPSVVKPEASLFEAIANLGGLNKEEAVSTWGIEPKDIGKRFGKPVLRKEGRSLDDMATALAEHGYLAVDKDGKPDLHDLENAFSAELSGNKQYSMNADYEAIYGKEQPVSREAGKLNTNLVKQLKGNVVSEADIAKLEKMRMLKDGEIDPEIVSNMFGFESAEDLVHSLASAEHPLKAIENRTDQIMLERHGELVDPQAIERAAEAAIHNEARAKFIAAELKAVSQTKATSKLMVEAAKSAAEQTIAEKKINDLRPLQYTAAEARAGREAEKAMAKGDIEKVAEWKRSQLLNNQLAKVAAEAIDAVNKGKTWQARFDKESIRNNMDVDIRDQIDQLRDQFDFRQNPTRVFGEQSLSTEQARKQERLVDWARSQQAFGYTPDIADWIADIGQKTPYKELTVEQFRGLMDTMKTIEYIGKQRKSVTVEGKKMAVMEIVNAMSQKMIERGEKFTDQQLAERPRIGVDPLWKVTLDRATSFLRSIQAEVTAQHFKANKFDLHEIMGPFHRYLFEPIFAANYRFMDMRKEVSDAFRATAKELGSDWQKSLNDVITNHNLMDNSLSTPAKRRLTRSDLLMIALHSGNESNFDKLTKGMGWRPEDVWAAIHNNMRESDFTAVKALGKAAGVHWDEMVDMNRRLGNTSPEKIEPRPFMTQFGEMPGWYAPVKYDPIRSRLGIRKSEAIAVNPAEGLFSKNYYRADTTTNGSLNARIAGYHDFIDLDFHSLEKSIQDSIRDLAYREAMVDVHKLYANQDFRSQFQRTYGPEEYKSLGNWLGNLVNAEVGEERQSKLTAILRATRRAIVANGIAFRITTMEKHGGSAALKSTGYFAGGGEKYFAARMKEIALHNTTEIADALAKFPEIRARYQMQDRDFSESVSSLFEPESLHGKAERFGHAGVAWLDFLTAVPTAHAAYDWAVTEGIPKRLGGTGEPMSEQDAIKFASSMVREAHGTNIESGRSMLINNKSELVKNLTILHGFMNNALGQNLDAMDKMLHANGFGKPELLARYMMSQIVPAAVLMGIANKSEPLWKFIMDEYAGLIPMLREAYAVVGEGITSAGLPPWLRALGDTAKAGKSIIKGSEGEPVTHPIKDLGNASGLFLPGLGQAGATAQFLYNVKTGEDAPETVGDWMRGISYGKSELKEVRE